VSLICRLMGRLSCDSMVPHPNQVVVVVIAISSLM